MSIRRAWCYVFHWRNQRRETGFGWHGWRCGICTERWFVFEDWVKDVHHD